MKRKMTGAVAALAVPAAAAGFFLASAGSAVAGPASAVTTAVTTADVTTPGGPVQPATSTQPGGPVQPVASTQPGGPVQPAQPAQPGSPVKSAPAPTRPAPAKPAPARPAPAPRVTVKAWVSNAYPKDGTTEYINVDTMKDAKVTTVAHFKNGEQVRTTYANSKGDATVAYNVGWAQPGYPVHVTVTATEGPSSATTYTQFTPQQ